MNNYYDLSNCTGLFMARWDIDQEFTFISIHIHFDIPTFRFMRVADWLLSKKGLIKWMVLEQIWWLLTRYVTARGYLGDLDFATHLQNSILSYQTYHWSDWSYFLSILIEKYTGRQIGWQPSVVNIRISIWRTFILHEHDKPSVFQVIGDTVVDDLYVVWK